MRQGGATHQMQNKSRAAARKVGPGGGGGEGGRSPAARQMHGQQPPRPKRMARTESASVVVKPRARQKGWVTWAGQDQGRGRARGGGGGAGTILTPQGERDLSVAGDSSKG